MSLRALTGLVAYCHGHSFNELWPPVCAKWHIEKQILKKREEASHGAICVPKSDQYNLLPLVTKTSSLQQTTKETIWRTSTQLRYLLHTYCIPL